MRYTIEGNLVPAVEMTLERGERVFTQSGGMSWLSEGIRMETNTRGGFMKGLTRMLAGESMFMATFTAERDGAVVAFSGTAPGSVLSYDLSGGEGLIAQRGSFLCAEDGVDISVAFTKKFSAGMFGGDGFVLQDLHGEGRVFLAIDGDRIERTLAPGEVIKVDTGNVVAFEKSVSYEVEMVRGMANLFLGGEGLFLTKLTGPGKIVLQTMSINDFAARVAEMIPSKDN